MQFHNFTKTSCFKNFWKRFSAIIRAVYFLTHFWPMFLFYTAWKKQDVFKAYKIGTWLKTRMLSCFFSSKWNSDPLIRSSRPEVFCWKHVFKNFKKFAGNHLCLSLFLIKLRSATLFKKRLWHRCFPVNFAKFLRTPFLKIASGLLLLIHRVGCYSVISFEVLNSHYVKEIL